MRKIILILSLLFITDIAYSQVKGMSGFDMENMLKEDMIDKLNSEQLMNSNGLPFGNVVEAENYFVGPGDILLIQNLSSLTQKDIIVVTAENKLVIPRIGEIDLKSKTLKETRELIIETIRGNFKDALVYVTLYKPRNVIVEINGNVSMPGTYTYPASFKISTLLKYVNQQKSSNMVSMQQNNLLFEKSEKNKQFDELFSNSGLPYVSTFANRNILVFHTDGVSEVADLEKSQANNDTKYDPYIREGDKIYVPYENVEYPVITIAGSVIRPFITAFKNGDMASMLLKFGGGLKENADLNNVKLILPESGKKLNLIIDNKLNISGDDIPLEPGSIITVGQKAFEPPNLKGVVSIVGNVNNPGVYPITNDQTTIKEIIENAGGFTDEAYLPLAYIIRRDESINDQKSTAYKIMDKFQNSTLTMYDTARFKMDIINRQPLVACDFVAAFEMKIESANITLQDGDIIKIPSNPKTVFVFGQVNNPGYIKFEENKNMEWYIKQAGGYAPSAEISATRIIRGKNRIWVEGSKKVYVFAGDEIYVPAPPNIPAEIQAQKYMLYVNLLSAGIAIIYLILNIIQYNKNN